MSRESDQDIVMLVSEMGFIATLIDGRSFARVDIKKALSEAYGATGEAIKHWAPGARDNRQWIASKKEEFFETVRQTSCRENSHIVAVLVMEQIIIDLLEKYSGVIRKAKMLDDIYRPVRVVREFCDKEGRHFIAREIAKELTDALYEIIGMRVAA